MAETKNYVSKYSGDQLDAAIAVLGSLGTMFFSQSDFNTFVTQFNAKMSELNGDVKKVLDFARKATIFAVPIDEQSNNG